MPWKCLFFRKKKHISQLWQLPCWLPQVNLWELLTEMIDQSAGGRILEPPHGKKRLLLQIFTWCLSNLTNEINEFSWFRKPWIVRSAERRVFSIFFFRWKSPKILGQIGKSRCANFYMISILKCWKTTSVTRLARGHIPGSLTLTCS